MKEKYHRCPWCGVITDTLGLGRFNILTCSNCKRRYTYYRDGLMHKLNNIMSFIVCVFSVPLSLLNIYICLIFIFIIINLSSLFLKLASYERIDDNKKFEHKKYKAKFKFTENELSYIKRRYFLQDKSIIPVCFVNDNGIALSNMICVCMEDTKKITNSEFDCVFSFLPLSDAIYNIIDENIKFFFYKDYKKVGEGIVFNQINGF